MNSSQILSAVFDAVIAIAIIGGLGGLLYQVIFKKKSISDAITANPKALLELITVISIVLEVLSLSILAANRGVPLSAALSRYVLAATFELLFAFMFSASVARAIADRKITSGEFAEMFMYFGVATAITFLIHIFYIESLAGVAAYSNGIFPSIKEGDNVKMELGALLTIWISVPLNFINALFQWKYGNPKKVTSIPKTTTVPVKENTVKEKIEAKADKPEVNESKLPTKVAEPKK